MGNLKSKITHLAQVESRFLLQNRHSWKSTVLRRRGHQLNWLTSCWLCQHVSGLVNVTEQSGYVVNLVPLILLYWFIRWENPQYCSKRFPRCIWLINVPTADSGALNASVRDFCSNIMERGHELLFCNPGYIYNMRVAIKQPSELMCEA